MLRGRRRGGLTPVHGYVHSKTLQINTYMSSKSSYKLILICA